MNKLSSKLKVIIIALLVPLISFGTMEYSTVSAYTELDVLTMNNSQEFLTTPQPIVFDTHARINQVRDDLTSQIVFGKDFTGTDASINKFQPDIFLLDMKVFDQSTGANIFDDVDNYFRSSLTWNHPNYSTDPEIKTLIDFLNSLSDQNGPYALYDLTPDQMAFKTTAAFADLLNAMPGNFPDASGTQIYVDKIPAGTEMNFTHTFVSRFIQQPTVTWGVEIKATTLMGQSDLAEENRITQYIPQTFIHITRPDIEVENDEYGATYNKACPTPKTINFNINEEGVKFGNASQNLYPDMATNQFIPVSKDITRAMLTIDNAAPVSLTTNSINIAEISENLAVGSHSLQLNYTAPDSVDADSDPGEVYAQGKTFQIQVIDDATLCNPGTAEITKYDEETNELLTGMKYNIVSVDTGEVFEFDMGDTSTSIVTDLLPGKYQLIETTAPVGYEVNSSPIDFEIRADEATRVSVYNKKTPTDPTDPTDPTEPTEPTAPTEPTVPSEPEVSTETQGQVSDVADQTDAPILPNTGV